MQRLIVLPELSHNMSHVRNMKNGDQMTHEVVVVLLAFTIS